MRFLPSIPSSKIAAWMIHTVGIALLVVGFGATETLVIFPMQRESSVASRRISELEAQVADGTKIRAEFEKLRGSLEAKRAKQRAFQERLPSEPLEAEFLAQIARLAEKVDLRVKDYRPGKVTERGDYSEVMIEFSGEASYESLCRFLHELPQIPRLNSLVGIEVQSKAENSMYPIRLNFSAYFVPMKKESRG